MDYKQVKEDGIYETPIQRFYAGQSIFITGGTGFLGKVLVEKLLRSCLNISTIYLLIRSKKDKCAESRLDEMFKISLYDQLKEKMPNFRKKIVPIIGDLNHEGLGLSENDRNLLIREVSIVFHVGAIVRFNENLKTATAINVIATGTLLDIAKHMPNLKSFVHVSSLYANSHVKHIEECFYTYPINHKKLIELVHTLPENVINQNLNSILSQWPNTYTFTKAIAEALLKQESSDLPIGIFRPAAVIPSANEPVVGWTDNWYGPVGITLAFLQGYMRFFLCQAEFRMTIVPVDFTINALIASAWDISNQCRNDKTKLIYNFIDPINAPTWGEYRNKMCDLYHKYPVSSSLWFPSLTLVRRKLLYKICIGLCHLLPALLVDAIRICLNRRPRMWTLCTKVHKYHNAIAPFINNKWNYSTDNIQAMWNRLNEKDQQLFKFNMIDFDWSTYITNYYKGIRFYLLNEDDNNSRIARIKYRRLYWMHQMLKCILIFIALVFIGIVYSRILLNE